MNYAHYKREFISYLLRSGDSDPANVPEYMQAVPLKMRQRWVECFYKASRPEHTPLAQPRLVNHFMIGADPEFMFMREGKPVYAETLGLIAGLCVGADNNTRLVELRPKPSRFVLRVLASIASELRWLALVYPRSLDYEWKAGAFAGTDGLGGHVHFGRKRYDTRKFEIAALDHLHGLLETSEVFSKQECLLRRKEAHGGHYGQFGDVRDQVHGWEYRTLPSWLNSPWLAYLSMVLAKLVVHDYALGGLIPVSATASQARRWIRNILARYKDLDDDARIAYLGLDVWGLPRANQFQADFKSAWGVVSGTAVPFKIPTILPPYIEPSTQDIEEMFRLMVYGQSNLGMPPSPPTWEFQFVPEEYIPLQLVTSTRVSPGLGELVWDGVTIWPRDREIRVSCIHNVERPTVAFDQTLARDINFGALKERFPEINFWNRRIAENGQIQFSRCLLQGARLKRAREILYSGLLPVARYDQLDSLAVWADKFKSAKPERTLSRVLFQG